MTFCNDLLLEITQFCSNALCKLQEIAQQAEKDFLKLAFASKGKVQLIRRLVRPQISFRLGLKTACSLTGLSGLL